MRRSRLLPGLIAAIVGLLGWLYALFGPTGQYASTEVRSDGSVISSESGWTSLWSEQDFHVVTVLFLLVMLVSVIGVFAGTVLHGRLGASTGRVVLWVSAIVLLLGSMLSLFSVGLFLFPGALLAVVAAVLSGFNDDRSRNVAAS